ncbi:tetratricopeptide repeat protein [Saccharopolyspora spinosa]|uniref:tetratricopeptide repeat protein n=1 Tax=Saccharopolyspora spinosa TaxID=60894 RepID=UPI001ED965A7|nr:tetratricopeptide repeat protein [Saccharopolyspora spinosa]
MERKTFLRALAGSIAGFTLVDPVAEFVASASPTGTYRRIGRAEIDHINHMARMFAGQDHLFGGELSADAAIAQLTSSAQLLNGQFSSETTRRELFAAMGDLADIAAGVCFDAGLHQKAESCFRFAAGCATEVGDWSLRAKALSGMANLAVHQERFDDALSYAEMALVRTDRLTPLVRSVMHTRHARALGSFGVEREMDCITAIRRAEDCFVGRSDNEPEWITYYDSSRLARDCGRALLGLALNGGDYREAQNQLCASIASFPASHSRGKALALANLATLIMSRADPVYAVDLGNDAITSVGQVRSDRVFNALRQLRVAGKRHLSNPAVRDLNRRIGEIMRTG